MKHITLEAREAILQKALNRNGDTLTEIAAKHNVGFSTLQKWLRKRRDEAGKNDTKQNGSKGKISQGQRFQHLLATAPLDENALGVYCRAHGLYSFQLTEWKDEFMSKNEERKAQGPTVAEFKALQAENILLKKELRRKDAALAETAALLVLKKKVNMLLGMDEDD